MIERCNTTLLRVCTSFPWLWVLELLVNMLDVGYGVVVHFLSSDFSVGARELIRGIEMGEKRGRDGGK